MEEKEPSKAKEAIKNEPVITAAAIGGALSAVLIPLLPQLWAALASYNVTITPELQNLSTAVIAIAIPAVAGLIARRFVTPVRKLRENEDGSYTAV